MLTSPLPSASRPNWWYDEFQMTHRELMRRGMPTQARALERGCLNAPTVAGARALITRYQREYLTGVQNRGTVSTLR